MTTLSLIIGDNASDGYETSTTTGAMVGSFGSSTTIECGPKTTGSPNAPISIFRFASGVTIPQAATITAATLTLTSDVPGKGMGLTALCTVACDNADNSATVTSTAHNIDARAQTASPVSWSASATSGAPALTSPSLVTPVQAVINRAGWVSGNALSFILNNTDTSGSDFFEAISHFSSGTTCAQASITYTAGGGGAAMTVPPMIVVPNFAAQRASSF